MMANQLLTAFLFPAPAVLLVGVFCWWGIYNKSKKTPTAVAALRAMAASLVACVLLAVGKYDTPQQFMDQGMFSIFVVAVVVTVVMLIYFPGSPRAHREAIQEADQPVLVSAPTATSAERSENNQMQRLSTAVRQSWPLIGVIVLVGLAWMLRYETVPAPAGERPAAYVLDRWTGNITLYIGAQYMETQPPRLQ
jgi:small-conductance mechanosensitive channel